jgi:hypothetical protein
MPHQVLDTLKESRLPQFGYEIGKEIIMDVLMREQEHWLSVELAKVTPQSVSLFSFSVTCALNERLSVELAKVPPQSVCLFLFSITCALNERALAG